MKKSKIASAAIAAIFFIALFLGLRIWASARAVAITGPSAIKQGADGSIYIMSNDVLYVHDSDGDLIERIPMSRFGIDRVIGDFWVYKNGDLLLRRDVPQTLTASGEAELFARTGAGEKDRLGTGESILERCSFATFQCKNFGEGGNVFDKLTAFSLMVDEEAGITYLSDTIGHQLLMLDERGNVLKKSTAAFQFPNQIVLDRDGFLYAADTTNHRLAAVTVEKEKFGTVEKEIRIIHPRNPLEPTWPMALARTADDKWWVINADDNMSYGIVMILSGKGQFEKTVPLPRGADPLRLVAAGANVLITDPALMRVYAVSPAGALLADFGSLSFKLELSELRRERRQYETIATASMWALLLLLVFVLVLALQSRVQEAAGGANQADPLADGLIPARPDSGTRRYDYHNLLALYRVKFAVVSVLLVALLAFFFLISRGLTVFHKQFFPAALLGHFAVSFFSYLHFKRSFIELSQQGITYQGMARSVYSPWNGVKKISVYGNISKVVTDYGNFSIGLIEPADNPPGGWLDHLRSKRVQFHKELIEEIQRRAPQAKIHISWLVRYQWKRLPSTKTAGEGAQKSGAGSMLEKSDAGQLDKAWLMIKIIWGALIGSLAVYLPVCKFMEDRLTPLSPGLPIETMRVIFFGIAMVTVAGTSYIRKALLKVSEGGTAFLFARRHQQHPAAAKYLTAIVVAMALSESIGIYGMVLFFLSKDAPTLYLFILISAIAMFYYRPRKEELMQVAVEMQKSQGA